MTHVSSWTPDEDTRLLAAFEEFGGDNLEKIALRVGGGRSRRACRARYTRIMKNRATEDAGAVTPGYDADLDDPDPVAVLQARRDPEFLGAPSGFAVYDSETGRGITQRDMDARLQRMWPGLQAKLEAKLGRPVDQDTQLPLDALVDLLHVDDDLLDMLTDAPPEPSLYDQAVAALSMQLAARNEDAEGTAARQVNSMLEKAFGPDHDLESPDVASFLDEFVRHQLKQFKPLDEAPGRASSSNVDLSKHRQGHDVRLGSNGRLVRLTIVTDPATGVQTLDEAYSDMEEIEKAMESWAATLGMTAKAFVANSMPRDLLMMLPVVNDKGAPDDPIPRGPARRSVRENVDRLFSLTGRSVDETSYIKTSLEVYKKKKWFPVHHIHGETSAIADPNDKIPYKNGVSILKTKDEIIINEFSVWCRKTWCDTAIVIDTSRDVWKVTNHLIFGYGAGFNAGKPYSREEKAAFDKRLEAYVDALADRMEYNRSRGATYVWTTTRPSMAMEVMCKARVDSDDYPILVEMDRPIVHSSRAQTARIPQGVARDIRSGKHVIKIRHR